MNLFCFICVRFFLYRWKTFICNPISRKILIWNETQLWRSFLFVLDSLWFLELLRTKFKELQSWYSWGGHWLDAVEVSPSIKNTTIHLYFLTLRMSLCNELHSWTSVSRFCDWETHPIRIVLHVSLLRLSIIRNEIVLRNMNFRE